MKPKKLFITIVILLNICISCKKRDMNVLPAETQDESFGCMLNNKVWVNEGALQFGVAGLQVGISKNGFTIVAVKSNNTLRQQINFNISQPLKVGLYYFNSLKSSASFIDIKQRCLFTTDSTLNWGTLEITKYDTVQKKVMGRFSFKAPSGIYGGVDTIKRNKDSIITITEGRFNIMY